MGCSSIAFKFSLVMVMQQRAETSGLLARTTPSHQPLHYPGSRPIAGSDQLSTSCQAAACKDRAATVLVRSAHYTSLCTQQSVGCVLQLSDQLSSGSTWGACWRGLQLPLQFVGCNPAAGSDQFWAFEHGELAGADVFNLCILWAAFHVLRLWQFIGRWRTGS